MNRLATTEDLNAIALVKGDERYVLIFHDHDRAEALRQVGRMASNPDLAFSWYDAACLAQRIRQGANHD